MPQIKSKSLVTYILLTWLLCGTLDMLAAVIINPKVPLAIIFKYIASGFFGKDAMKGEADMVVAGVLFHYLIAFIFTFILFRLYPWAIKIVHNQVVLAIVYGLLIWVVMNLLVVPYLSHITPMPMHVAGVLKNMAALIVAFGFPITFIAPKYYK